MTTTGEQQNRVRRPAVEPFSAKKARIAHELSTDPFTDWALVIAVFLLAVAVLVGTGVSMYLETGSALSASPSSITRSSAPTVDAKVLQTVLDEFESREALHAALTKGYSAPKDPSVP